MDLLPQCIDVFLKDFAANIWEWLCSFVSCFHDLLVFFFCAFCTSQYQCNLIKLFFYGCRFLATSVACSLQISTWSRACTLPYSDFASESSLINLQVPLRIWVLSLWLQLEVDRHKTSVHYNIDICSFSRNISSIATIKLILGYLFTLKANVCGLLWPQFKFTFHHQFISSTYICCFLWLRFDLIFRLLVSAPVFNSVANSLVILFLIPRSHCAYCIDHHLIMCAVFRTNDSNSKDLVGMSFGLASIYTNKMRNYCTLLDGHLLSCRNLEKRRCLPKLRCEKLICGELSGVWRIDSLTTKFVSTEASTLVLRVLRFTFTVNFYRIKTILFCFTRN